jgi:four helix bundle protein
MAEFRTLWPHGPGPTRRGISRGHIAEGAAKRGGAEFRRYLDISVGSLAELACLLRLALDLGFVEPEDAVELNSVREVAAKLTWRLYRSMTP